MLLVEQLGVGAHPLRVAPDVVPVRKCAQGLFEGECFFDFGVDVAACEPVVAELGPAVQVDGGDDAHVALSPFAAAVGDLVFEKLERIESELGLGDFEGLFEDVGGFVLH